MMTKLGRTSSKESVSDEIPSTSANNDHSKRIQLNEQLRRLEDNDPDLAMAVQFTKSHPIGGILFKLAQDNTILAGDKGLATNIPDLCATFHSAIQVNDADIEEKLNEAHVKIHKTLIDKELNSHVINTTLKPPTIFSNEPVITSSQKLAEILKVFHRGNKFSGSKQDSSISIVEYLNMLKTAQNQCKLSREEFIDRMLETSTGLAHELLLEWVQNGESIETIYHNLLVTFDKRMSPEEAKQQLTNFKIPKSSSLAKAEAQIMILASRAASKLPEGQSRIDNYNLESINALIRALPRASSTRVNNEYTQLSAKLGRTATAAELSRKLNVFRDTIDQDIKEHGADTSFRMKTKNSTVNRKKNNRYVHRDELTAFNMMAARALARQAAGYPTKKYAYNTNSFTPKPVDNLSKYFYAHPPSKNNNSQNNKAKNLRSKRKAPPRGPNGKFIKLTSYNNQSTRSCLLCGMSNHNATSCRNMRDDKGEIQNLIPTRGTCEKCPGRAQGRLHHPSNICPYRPGGVFNRNANSRK